MACGCGRKLGKNVNGARVKYAKRMKTHVARLKAAKKVKR
jgi:hypothetical protein